MLNPIHPDFINIPQNLTIEVSDLTDIYVVDIAIRNDGDGVMLIGTITIDNTNDFSPLVQPPTSSLQPGLSTFFTVSSVVPGSGDITGQITIPNSDATKIVTLLLHYPTVIPG